MRGSLVPLAVYCGGCRELAAATPSPLRALPSCFGVPHRLQFTTRALITLAAARHLARCANGRRCAHSARGPLPALSVPLSGPQLPEAPPGLRPESGSRATPSVFVGSRQPPELAARAMGAASPGCKGRRLFAGAFRGAGGWGVRLPGRAFPSAVCRFYRSLVAYGVLRASLRFARGTHRLAPVRQTTSGAPWQTHALSSRQHPETLLPA